MKGYDDTIQAIINSTGDGVIRISPVQINRKDFMKRKNWTSEEIERARELLKTHSYATVGQMLHRSKNSVIGQFYREKVLKGYTPPPDSKYTHKKEKNISLDN